MHWGVFSVIFTAILSHLSLSHATDYCKFSENHTLCGSPGISPRCGEVIYTEDKLPIKTQKIITKAFNTYRNKVAGGLVKVQDGTLPQAANMMKLVWDHELADVAEAHAKQCLFEHTCEQCRRVGRFPTGETMYLEESTDERKETWEDIVSKWTSNEEKNITVKDIKSYTDVERLDTLTQSIWAKTRYVGCGRMIFPTQLNSPEHPGNSTPHPGYSTMTSIAVCQFGPSGNEKKQEVYLQGKPCSKCPDKMTCSATYPNLCSRPTTTSGQQGEFSQLNWIYGTFLLLASAIHSTFS